MPGLPPLYSSMEPGKSLLFHLPDKDTKVPGDVNTVCAEHRDSRDETKAGPDIGEEMSAMVMPETGGQEE